MEKARTIYATSSAVVAMLPIIRNCPVVDAVPPSADADTNGVALELGIAIPLLPAAQQQIVDDSLS